jgi:hypothetical protein
MRLTTRARRIAAATTTTLAAAGLAIGISTLALAAPGTHAAAARVLPCDSHGVDVWMNIPGNGAAGTIFYKLHFTNLSGSACTLNGFPFIHAVNLAGHPLGNRAAFDRHLGAPHPVTLGKGKTVTTTLAITDVGNLPPSKCKPVTAAGIEVFAPSGINEIGRVVPIPFGACTTIGKLAPTFMRVGGV